MKQLYSDIILVISIMILFLIGVFSYSIYRHVYKISSILEEYTIIIEP